MKTPPPSIIAFNYKIYKETKNIHFICVEEYKIQIKDGSKTRVADKVEISDIEFVGITPVGILIKGVEVLTMKIDGSKIKVIFQAIKGETPLIPSQGLDGIVTYKVKAWKIINAMNANNFQSIKDLKILPSAYVNKNAILDLIHKKIGVEIDDIFNQKIKGIIAISDITLISNNVDGSLTISVDGIGSNTKEIIILGFLTWVKIDVDAIKTEIDAISGMTKITNSNIIVVSTNTSFNAVALSSLGTELVGHFQLTLEVPPNLFS